MDIKAHRKSMKLTLNVWHGNKKKLASLNTICSHITNLIFGVTLGFEYRMRFVYAHFPINIEFIENGTGLKIRNFLGEKRIRKVYMSHGVICFRDENLKDEIVLQGNDLNLVSSSAASVQQSCLIKNKDIRKFLDGIYVTKKGRIE
mmetsp:Transcript_61263/g.126554  ORF Transcript_61263/g.126554 Transcript_61263/m.126554 type:complete len:146 (-) Transcript_61263:4686-5123(-)